MTNDEKDIVKLFKGIKILEKENAQLRAQLARCVEGLETYRRCFEDGFASKILEELPKQAKPDAEVLRCAYAYAGFELELEHTGAGKPDTAHAEDLIEAVRAAKEE